MMEKLVSLTNQIKEKLYSKDKIEIGLLISVILAVILKFSIFYNLVDVKSNFVILIGVSSFITWLLIDSMKNKWITVSIYFVISFVMFADITYFSFFNRYLSLGMLGAADVAGDIGESIKQVMKPINFIMFFDVALMYGVILYKKIPLKKNTTFEISRKSLIKPLIAIIIITTITTNLMGINLLTSLSNQEIYSYRVKDFVTTIFGGKVEAGDILNLKYESQKTGPHFGIGEGKNLIVIQLESVQNFVVGRKYNGQEITPNLNKLIEGNSIYFSNYYQQTGSGNTSDAEFASNNSILGVLTSYTNKIYPDNYFRGLPVLLKEKGYSTAVFHAHESRGFWNREQIYPKVGFDRFYGGIINDTQNRPNGDYFMNEWMGWGLTDSKFYQQTIPYMKEMKEPFYSFVISLSNHHPYVMLDKYNFIELLPEDKDTLAGNYLNSVAYTDYALGEFVDYLKDNGMYENSIIAIYGDHAGLVNNDETDQVMSRILDKKYDFEEVMHIPLIFHIPGIDENIRATVDTAGGQLDFLPTIAYLMGFDKLDTIYLGQNLITAKKGFVAEHTFMVKGSFFLDDICFEMSRDGIFENGRGWNIKTGETVSTEGLYEYYKRSLSISETSQYILDNDVLKKVYLENLSLEEAFEQ